jgi:hypothetical protein
VIDETHPSIDPSTGQAVAEPSHIVKDERNDDRAVAVDKTPGAVATHRREPLGKAMAALERSIDDDAAGQINVSGK